MAGEPAGSGKEGVSLCRPAKKIPGSGKDAPPRDRTRGRARRREPADREPEPGRGVAGRAGEKDPGEGLVAVGKITGTYGVRGWLRVLPLTDFPERFFKLKRVFLTGGEAPGEYHVEQVKAHGRFFLLKFKEVPDAGAAPALKGALLRLPKEELIPLPPDTYYIFELLGMAVYSTEGEHLGELRDVLQTGANDVYVVESGRGAPLLIPALRQVVKKVDLAGRRMIVDLPPGLRE